MILVRQGRYEEALEVARPISDGYLAAAIEARITGDPMDPEVLQAYFEGTMTLRDPEQFSWNGRVLAVAGENEAALQLTREAIKRGFCSYPYLDTDPLYNGLRSDPELADAWDETYAAARECHERFLAEIGGS